MNNYRSHVFCVKTSLLDVCRVVFCFVFVFGFFFGSFSPWLMNNRLWEKNEKKKSELSDSICPLILRTLPQTLLTCCSDRLWCRKIAC